MGSSENSKTDSTEGKEEGESVTTEKRELEGETTAGFNNQSILNVTKESP